MHLQFGYANPLEEPLFKHQKTLLIRGIKQIHGTPVSQKCPITPDVLYKIQTVLNLNLSLEATFWAACLVAFFSFFRKSNLLPPSVAAFDPHPHLRNCDVRLYPWGIILVVHWSKTIQYRNRTLLVPVPRIAHSSLCPWSAVTHAFKLAGVYQSPQNAVEPAFTFRESHDLKTLTYSIFNSKRKQTQINAALTACASMDTPLDEEALPLPCIAVYLVTILSFKVTGSLMLMNSIYTIHFATN